MPVEITTKTTDDLANAVRKAARLVQADKEGHSPVCLMVITHDGQTSDTALMGHGGQLIASLARMIVDMPDLRNILKAAILLSEADKYQGSLIPDPRPLDRKESG